MSLFTELKRRNVFRVAVAYVVASWLLLQVTDVLMQILELPDATGKFVFLALVLGFVPALVISWVYEMTPDGLRKDTGVSLQDSRAVQMGQKMDRITLILALIAIVAVVVDRLIPEQHAPPSNNMPVAIDSMETEEPSKEKETVDRSKSLAVLPFTNMSPDPDNEYFADGISEELLNALVEIEELRVPSRTSSFAFKGQNRDIRDIAGQLEVGHVLEGSVRKAGNRVRITAQLIDVSTDEHLWSETYERQLKDIFAIQDEIAGHIVEALKVSLALETSPKPTSNLEAYTLYLQGRELFRRRANGEQLLEADRVLREAVEIAPEFADAWAMLAMVQVILPGYTKEEWEDYIEPATGFAERALVLDPNQVDAKLATGLVMGLLNDSSEVLDQFRAVVEQHPRHSLARLFYAIALYRTGYLEQAFEHISIAAKLDPVHSTILDWFARIALAAVRPELVVEYAERAIQLGRQQGRVPLMQHFIHEGTISDVEPYIKGVELNWGGFRWAFEVRDDPGKLPEAMAWADQYKRDGHKPDYFVLFFRMVTESSDEFFRKLIQIQAVDETIDVMVWIPAATRHRQGEAMKSWAKSRGYEELWRERGWPDLCHPVDDDDWECD